MTTWHVILTASVATLTLKLGGYFVPAGLLERERPARIADLLTVALLAALIAVQTLGSGQAIVFDARVPAVIVAAATQVVGTASVSLATSETIEEFWAGLRPVAGRSRKGSGIGQDPDRPDSPG